MVKEKQERHQLRLQETVDFSSLKSLETATDAKAKSTENTFIKAGFKAASRTS